MTLNPPLPTMLFLASSVLLAAVACGPSSTPTGAAETANPTAGAEAGGGEAIPVPYTDSRFHYRIDAPGRMTANPDGTAAYLGPSERLEIGIVQSTSTVDSNALASQDIKSLASSAPAFHQLFNPAKLTLGGYQVTRFAYTWNAGTSTVTGKAIELTSVRYYLLKDSKTVAVITYGIVTNQFDPQGADDIVSTFRWQ
jgi:hypothetical protein